MQEVKLKPLPYMPTDTETEVNLHVDFKLFEEKKHSKMLRNICENVLAELHLNSSFLVDFIWIKIFWSTYIFCFFCLLIMALSHEQFYDSAPLQSYS